MTKELREDLKQIVNLCYCHEGEKEYKEHIELVSSICNSKEMKEIIKEVKKEIRKIDKIFDEYYK